MNPAIKSFLARDNFDDCERLAMRSIHALHELRRLSHNFAVNGRSAFYANCQEAIRASIYAFCCLNTVKRFTFANQVDGQVAEFTAFVAESLSAGGGKLSDHTVCAVVEDALQFAEGMVETHKPLYRPVALVSGISSVLILRGDHCTMAARDLKPANSNTH